MEFVNGQNLYRAHKFDWNFFTPVTGCTDSSACNYDPQSNVDDGSCFYQISIYDTLSSSSSISAVFSALFPLSTNPPGNS